jgi:hypothetical protein
MRQLIKGFSKNLLKVAFVSFAWSVVPAIAQSEREKLVAIEQGREQEKQRLMLQKLDSAVELMGIGQYEAADKKFLVVLAKIKSVPSDLTYYFGENSYHLGLARQSVDWLNKYIQLKGTSGKFYNDAVLYLKKAEEALITIKSEEAAQATVILSRNYDIDCGPTGRVICPVCNGSTVVVKRNYLGDTYKTCGHCNKLGYLTCVEYNKLLRGELIPDGK